MVGVLIVCAGGLNLLTFGGLTLGVGGCNCPAVGNPACAFLPTILGTLGVLGLFTAAARVLLSKPLGNICPAAIALTRLILGACLVITSIPKPGICAGTGPSTTVLVF